MTPQTEAGKRLLDGTPWTNGASRDSWGRLIAAIEAEARRTALMEARAAAHVAMDNADEVGWDDARTSDLRPESAHAAIDAAIDALMDPEPDER